MEPAQLAESLLAVVRSALERRGADSADVSLDDIALERPRNRDHGDWATSVALKLAKRVGVPPRELAAELQSGLAAVDGVASVEIAGPGFLNIRLDAAAAGSLVATILEQGERYGTSQTLAGQSINLEFVSANPTGPLHIGHTRWAALGDSLARVLSAAGAEVTSEFYINDAGAQLDVFGESVLAAALGEPAPENAYPGQYIADFGARALAEHPELATMSRADAVTAVRELAYGWQLSEIQQSLAEFNVHFDVWFSERELHAAGGDGAASPIDQAVDRLRAQGHVFDEDGAVWVRTTDFGDDKDRVIRRANGVYTYFAADAAYYLSKRDRGFGLTIYLLGADHHGYVHR